MSLIICPKGHVGWGILLETEAPIEAANGDIIERQKYECEVCGEIWWEYLPDEEENDER